MLQQYLTSKNIFLFIGIILLILMPLSNIFSEEQTSKEDVKSKIKGPIVIKSDRLIADNRSNTALFEGSVVANTPDITMYSDKMLVYYERKTGNIKKIESEGNVRVIKDDRVIVSQKAVYYADGEKVVFTGNPRAAEGENVVTGEVMTYFINDDRYLVEDGKVFLSGEKNKK